MINPLAMDGRAVLVTGASSGIGRSTAVLLSQLGAAVVLAGRNPERLEQTRGALEGTGHHIAPFDLNAIEEIPRWLGGVVEAAGPLDGLVCAAGVPSIRPLRALDAGHFDSVMRINCSSAVALTTAFCKKRVRKAEAGVVLVASVAGLRGTPARSAYGASKGALIAFARSAAIEMASSGVRINCVAPGYVETEMYEKLRQELSPERIDSLVQARQPLGLGKPLDVAHSIAFLLSGAARWITGSVLCVDGGYTAQ